MQIESSTERIHRQAPAGLALFSLALMIGAGAMPARGATFTVNSTLDDVDSNPGNGFCHSTNARGCTLRAAIQEANALPGADEIVLPRTTFVLALAGGGEDFAATGDLDILDDLKITGGGATVDGMLLDRVFHVCCSSTVDVELRDLTVRQGRPFSEPLNRGGGVLNEGTLTLQGVDLIENDADEGGGIANLATVTLLGVDLVENEGVNGGGLANLGSATLVDSTVNLNSVTAGGGGIWNDGQMTIKRSTISRNTGVFGGGIENSRVGATLGLQNSTVSTNQSSAEGGGVWNKGALAISSSTFSANSSGLGFADVMHGLGSGATLFKNTILDAPPGQTSCDSAGTFLTAGFNLENGDSCGLDLASDMVNTNPVLFPLADNGGPTETHALPSASPAVDAITDPTQCVVIGGGFLTQDQRGMPRPDDGDQDGVRLCDIGAVEVNVGLVFVDGFESGDTSVWSQTVP